MFRFFRTKQGLMIEFKTSMFIPATMDASSLHMAMFPWFAMGHFTPYLHLSNKLAKRGHKISFIIPRKSQTKVEHLNHFPDLITFIPITVPQIDGLPRGSETTSDVPFSLYPLIMTSLDLTEKDIELHLVNLKPHIIFFDFAFWIPKLAQRLGIKSFQYLIVSPVTVSYTLSPARMCQGTDLTEAELKKPPIGFPESFIKLHAFETKFLVSKRKWEFGSGVLFYDRLYDGLRLSDAVGFKGCRETEGPYVDYLREQYQKPVLLSGPVIPEPPSSTLEDEWASWLGRFKAGCVVYCALGSECTLNQNQFQQLLLGLELSGMPFLAVLKTPVGSKSTEEAIPKGFKWRVKERGVVHGGWVQQQLILGHPSVGCFITHCGASSLTEGLMNDCQLVLLPHLDGDHIINARMMSSKLRVGVEIEKGEEDGLFTKESVCKAVRIVMDDENEVGREVRANHEKFRNLLLSNNSESSCLDNFCEKLQNLVKS